VLKGTHALGFARATENVTITNSLVSGYDIGSLLEGTYKRTVTAAPTATAPPDVSRSALSPKAISATLRSPTLCSTFTRAGAGVR